MSEEPPDNDDRRDGEDRERLSDGADTADNTDPFADVATDRAGDPFDGLGAPSGGPAGAADDTGDEPVGTRSDDDRSGDSGPTDDASAWQPLPEVSEADEAREADDGGISTASGAGALGGTAGLEPDEGVEDPFGDPDPRGDPFGDEGVFERQEVGDVDPDEVWEALEATEQVGGEEGRRYAEVSKHTYCENCEWFSEPPEVSCTREGTEIVEFLDVETVRLLSCPVVEERRAIRED
jgi:hypothetical protein